MSASFKHVIINNTEIQNNSPNTTYCWKMDLTGTTRRNLFSQHFNIDEINDKEDAVIGNDLLSSAKVSQDAHNPFNNGTVLFPKLDLENDFMATSAFQKKAMLRNKEIAERAMSNSHIDDDVVLVELDSLDVVIWMNGNQLSATNSSLS
ncbi:hypothetical protein C9374_002691 [Naegleria lovaniensis]|uniref:Uncharacterized protein n=1 Tax=Naegleria lovaniensis TaxID=51637 RepID=A0AA88KK12_NAELO|nr:uncharacterized protein C9374_002691 [Naegleria lovaniensis]KAG2386245.1 hypothetical protein C9374_002691 [Naegleria lovaniensis]